jgi:hypothetical protein
MIVVLSPIWQTCECVFSYYHENTVLILFLNSFVPILSPLDPFRISYHTHTHTDERGQGTKGLDLHTSAQNKALRWKKLRKRWGQDGDKTIKFGDNPQGA